MVFRPDANAFNLLRWIWPPALIALAVWMTVQSRRNLRSVTRRLMLYPLFVAVVMAGVGGSYETIQEQVDRSTTAMPGHLVDVGGRRLYLHCTGLGNPTVVLISGLAEASTYWGGWIAPAVARNLPGFPSFYSTIRRASALFPSLARLGLFRLVNQFVSDPLPAPARDEECAVTSTASLQRIQRDEFAELPMTLKEAAALTTIGDRPLIVVTAAKGTQTGWLPLQGKMTGLSTNSAHRVLPDIDHPGLIHDRAGAAQASQAILDVAASVRSGTLLAKS